MTQPTHNGQSNYTPLVVIGWFSESFAIKR